MVVKATDCGWLPGLMPAMGVWAVMSECWFFRKPTATPSASDPPRSGTILKYRLLEPLEASPVHLVESLDRKIVKPMLS